MEINIQIEGAKELASRWGAMPEHLKTLTRNAFNKAGMIVEQESKYGTPVKTGRLRSSIKSTYAMTGDPKATISPHTNYALFVHEGTRYMAGRPYMTEGYKKSESKIKSILSKLLKDIVQKMK